MVRCDFCCAVLELNADTAIVVVFDDRRTGYKYESAHTASFLHAGSVVHFNKLGINTAVWDTPEDKAHGR
jgi:hypothetical protein